MNVVRQVSALMRAGHTWRGIAVRLDLSDAMMRYCVNLVAIQERYK